jgi:hypothetical protein
MPDVSRMSQPPEDWDRSLVEIEPGIAGSARVAFPSNGAEEALTQATGSRSEGKRTLSELLKLHAEKGTDVNYTQEEAAKLEEVLGRWVRVCAGFRSTYCR